MGITRTLGGQRLGSGKKNKVYMHGFERSNHDLSYVFRSTMASGTLVPFMVEVGLPGDTFDIDLSCLMHTHPTVGPLFGTYKIQLDLYQIPMRLYNAKLHMNMLGIGLDMAQIKFPVIHTEGNNIDFSTTIDNQQINPSCILSYLNIRGLGHDPTIGATAVARKFNAIPYLAYFDIYKNYYANKQEEKGIIIHRPAITPVVTITNCQMQGSLNNINISVTPPGTDQSDTLYSNTEMIVTGTNLDYTFDANKLILTMSGGFDIDRKIPALTIFNNYTINPSTNTITYNTPNLDFLNGALLTGLWNYSLCEYINTLDDYEAEPILYEFPLENIDQMRKDILADVNNAGAFEINKNSIEPYNLTLSNTLEGATYTYNAMKWGQQGLLCKTYQSDLLNNWISTEWIDGVDGISAVTAIDTTSGSFTIDELNLSNKIYEMLMRIAVSGGSYDDWLDTVYDHDRYKSCENPMYMGGLIKELTFEEVVSTAENNGDTQPLGTLAGKGFLNSKNKGGKSIIKIDEPSYIMGIASITPRIDYSQGNKWDVNLETMNDLHKPGLDEIGFQDLLTDQMAWWDTETIGGVVTFKSAGKQPAWINYMTNINIIRGNFALENEQMFMVLNRRYEPEVTGTEVTIGDLTTYIDPKKFNHIFANSRRDAQNFWIQIGINMTARRKMSAKLMPNL